MDDHRFKCSSCGSMFRSLTYSNRSRLCSRCVTITAGDGPERDCWICGKSTPIELGEKVYTGTDGSFILYCQNCESEHANSHGKLAAVSRDEIAKHNFAYHGDNYGGL